MNENGKPIDLAKIANPFDFSNPVSKKDLFIGRENELKDIKYYLDHARTADRPINLAILGERAAGKTSLLNIIEIEGNERGLVPVRINLNESDVETHMAFWFKVFDTVLSKVVSEDKANASSKSFGGPNGRTYDTYLDLTSAYEIPTDKTFCPFLFPVRYAKSMEAGKTDARVSDQVIERDLRCIAEEIGRPILLLIDECNILSSERALLEMVRNTFMNLPGYMLVFTGTPDLFPLMDEVFSPIVRQFKRIEVAPFSEIRETNRAVMEPLGKIGQKDLFDGFPESFFDSMPANFISGVSGQQAFFPEGYLSDLHTLTNGRPYEIQLVCHFMFKRVQHGRDKKMRLSIEVLEDVLRELKQSHDEDKRPIISAVKALDEDDLNRLRVLLQSGGRHPLKQLFFVHGIFDKFPVEEYHDTHARLRSKDILGDVDGCTMFRGDDFDKIVCKYAAKKRGIDLSFDSSSPKGLLRVAQVRSMNNAIGRSKRSEIRIKPLYNSFRDSSLEALQSLWHRLDGMLIADLCEQCPEFTSSNYRLLASNVKKMREGLLVHRLEVTGFDLSETSFFMLAGANESEVSALTQMLEDASSRAKDLGGKLSFDKALLRGSSLDECFLAVLKNGTVESIKECVDVHLGRMVSSYLDDENLERALTEARLVAKANGIGLTRDDKSNLGFILLAGKEIDLAVEFLESAVAEADEPSAALAEYNLALGYLSQRKPGMAIQLLDRCLAHDNEERFANIAALLQVSEQDGIVSLADMIFKEDAAPTILSVYADKAKSIGIKLLEEMSAANG